MRDALITIAKALSYDKLSRLELALENYSYDFLIRVLHSSVKHTNNILFFPGRFYEIGIYGVKFHLFAAKGLNPDNYILSYPSLDEKFLRRLFSGIELVAYKLCHIAIENHRRNYNFETEKLRQRMRKLRGILAIDDWNSYFELFEEIMFTRDSFAHSFIDVVDLLYRRVPLGLCFGYTSTGTRGTFDVSFDGKYFFDEVRSFFEPIATAFAKCQLEQIDREKLFRFCDQIIKERSLAY